MKKTSAGVCFAILCWLQGGSAVAQDAKDLFERSRADVLQVLIMDEESDQKAAIGSGFRLAGGSWVATNFHVISEAVHAPDQYRVEVIDGDGNKVAAEIEHFDVVHDLGLLSLTDSAVEQGGLTVSERELVKGETVYSVGNPYDLGQTIVPGTFNGLLETSFYQKLLFSGSLNPGMSGGPSLDEQGNVVGVNVATSGNQISFLVPAKYLAALVKRRNEVDRLAESEYQPEIYRQLMADQEFKYALLLGLDWPTQDLGNARVAGDVSDYFKCWGDSNNDDDRLYQTTDTTCTSQDSIFISSSFQTGAIDYQYTWASSEELGELRFSAMMSQAMGSMYTRNAANEEDVSNYQCRNAFVGEADALSGKWRTVMCVRQYLLYPMLYDVLYMGALIGREQQGLTSHFALSGVTEANALAFLDKFMGLQSWGS